MASGDMSTRVEFSSRSSVIFGKTQFLQIEEILIPAGDALHLGQTPRGYDRALTLTSSS